MLSERVGQQGVVIFSLLSGVVQLAVGGWAAPGDHIRNVTWQLLVTSGVFRRPDHVLLLLLLLLLGCAATG
jgi:hypothetical protein